MSPSAGYHQIPADNGTIFPLNPNLDIGDNGGTPEWNLTGEFKTTDYLSDLTTELNSLISSTPTSYIDNYGNEFVDIVINITSNQTCEFQIREMHINYTYTEAVDKNPYTGNLVNALNELVPDVYEGNISIPIVVYSSCPGHINISNITIDYYIPDFTHDRMEVINGHGPDGRLVCTDYQNYIFLINLTNR